MSDPAKRGVALFQTSSGLIVHSDFVSGVDFDPTTRVINSNVGPNEAHGKVPQHLVVLTLGAAREDAHGAGGTVNRSFTWPGVNTPAGVEYIEMDPNLTSAKFPSSVAHELGHSVNIYHHGEFDDGEIKKWTLAPGGIVKENGVAIDPVDDSTGQAYVDTSEVPIGQILVSKAPGGPSSGDESCLMRYSSYGARAWPWDSSSSSGWVPANPSSWRDVTDINEHDLIGTRFCAGKAGSTFNAAGSGTAGSRWGPATVGDCVHQIRVNDKFQR